MKVGKQINKGCKCPECKIYGLKVYHYITWEHGRVEEVEGHGVGSYYDYMKCSNCLATFEIIKDEK